MNAKVRVTKSLKIKSFLPFFVMIVLLTAGTIPGYAHCDSLDGPVIKDAEAALKTNNVSLVFKWINEEQEQEITSLFKKTYDLQDGDPEIYELVKNHFFETLVRWHRETENAPYTGLKAAGTTEKIIQLSDKAIKDKDINDLINKLNNHTEQVIKDRFEKVLLLNEIKNESEQKGRKFVEAYVDYTHTIEALHDVLEHGTSH
ncbi:DUF6448 family protein [Anaerophaga thermohalophila]|uniref:DUF6448 family protein n=1 Tax=Anaerophaga thermohalophila TaxID=177400 RepID=UPI000366EAD5|nr:DUF6448 family protein [Anaerophaga thermohalophila]